MGGGKQSKRTGFGDEFLTTEHKPQPSDAEARTHARQKGLARAWRLVDLGEVRGVNGLQAVEDGGLPGRIGLGAGVAGQRIEWRG